MELTSLAVRRAPGLVVLATGGPVSDDGTTARFRASSVRDVAVALAERNSPTATATSQTRNATASHEVAHQWFYGLVGDDQARDPWLDESFATYAEALDRGSGRTYEGIVIPAGGRGRTGEPMTFWETRQSIYFRSVYIQGAVALLRARSAAGAAAFDNAIRCYVRRNAHRIATPDDLRQSLVDLPAALRVLQATGALR
jgi:aminopeptidase N